MIIIDLTDDYNISHRWGIRVCAIDERRRFLIEYNFRHAPDVSVSSHRLK